MSIFKFVLLAAGLLATAPALGLELGHRYNYYHFVLGHHYAYYHRAWTPSLSYPGVRS